ncbi:hypothetical protein [Methylibium rhizosphaerae]|uniref:hypothetical protein n=1 Tax=Methylibium rhizosphaerae TaxID=2570323 RepID=UPI00112E742D|nr:hypothetical protein [Methylibium rhizosphaerae]
MNRLQVLERLKLGRVVEAEVRAGPQGRRAFIEVHPLIDETVSELRVSESSIEPLLSRSTPNTNVVTGYRLRLCILNSGWEETPDDWDHFIHMQDWSNFNSLAELEMALSERFSIGLEELQIPGKTESPL